MPDPLPESARLSKGWPFPDLLASHPWGETQYGVFHDRRERGHGIALVQVTPDLNVALDAAVLLDGKGHVRSRHVAYSPWASPIYDDRARAISPAPSTPEDHPEHVITPAASAPTDSVTNNENGD